MVLFKFLKRFDPLAYYGGGWDDNKFKGYGIAFLVAVVAVLIAHWLGWIELK